MFPLCPKTYARSFPGVGIVRLRALALTAVQVSIFRKDAWDKRPYLRFILKCDGPQSGLRKT
jgi:hypothetical protein